MQSRTNSSDWNWPVFFEGFWLGFGKFVGAGFFFFCVLFPFSGRLSLTVEGMLMGGSFWVVLAALFGASAGDAAVRAWRERQWQERFNSRT